MSNQYEQALRLWGAQKLRGDYGARIDPETVEVKLDFNPGFACCGGRDPDCYCSYAESPSINVLITGRNLRGNRLDYRISGEGFDFFTLMRELSDIEIKESE